IKSDTSESVAQTTQTISVGGYDRPAGAAITRTVNGSTQLWVFACGADHVMRRKVLLTPDSEFRGWITVAGSFPCYSPPTLAKWKGTAPQEVINLFYRGSTSGNRLIHARYQDDGTSFAKDLSAEISLG